jgi:hypothetical protein
MFARRVLVALALPVGLFCPAGAVERTAGPAAAPAPRPEQPDSAGGEPSADRTASPENLPTIHQLITEVVRNNIPLEYEDTKDWGGTKEVFDGLKISRDGLHIKTKRRRKRVNDGTWKRYHVRLVDPQEEFRVRLEHAGPGGDGRLALDIVFVARLALFGRLSQWETGVQLISLSADAEAKVRLRVACKVALRFDAAELPPDVIFDPEVTDAALDLVEFRLRRISNARGPLVEQLGRGLREVLERKVAEKNTRLVHNINRQIDKRRDQLRLSLHDEIKSRWRRLMSRLDGL